MEKFKRKVDSRKENLKTAGLASTGIILSSGKPLSNKMIKGVAPLFKEKGSIDKAGTKVLNKLQEKAESSGIKVLKSRNSFGTSRGDSLVVVPLTAITLPHELGHAYSKRGQGSSKLGNFLHTNEIAKTISSKSAQNLSEKLAPVVGLSLGFKEGYEGEDGKSSKWGRAAACGAILTPSTLRIAKEISANKTANKILKEVGAGKDIKSKVGRVAKAGLSTYLTSAGVVAGNAIIGHSIGKYVGKKIKEIEDDSITK